MKRDIVHYTKAQISRIQSRNNFHPEYGARQIKDVHDRKVIGDFTLFQYCLFLIDKLKLDIPIPYDPSGLNPGRHFQERAAVLEYVYFARTVFTHKWKVGVSANPVVRCRQLQTGNPEHIEVLFRMQGNLELESLVKRYLDRFRTLGGGEEWFVGFPEVTVPRLIRRVQTDGQAFLSGPRLKRPSGH